MATKVTDLTELTTAANADQFLIEDDDAGETKRITFANLSTSLGAVDTSGTPADNQVAVFTDADTIEGDSNLTWDGTDLQVGGSNGITIDSTIISTAATTGNAIEFQARANDNQLVLATDGNVGVGAASPSVLFEVFSASGTLGLFRQTTQTTEVTQSVQVSGDSNPRFVWDKPDEGVDAKIWDAVVTSGAWSLRALTDDVLSASTGITVNRSGSSVTSVDLAVDAGHVKLRAPNTSTGTSLLVATNDGSLQEVQRDSSTLRFKDDVQPITASTVDPSDVLAIQPIHYTRNGRGEVGFGAEHWHGIGLDDGLAYDEDDEVAGFLAGSRMIDAGQQIVLQDHEARIAELEERVRGLAA